MAVTIPRTSLLVIALIASLIPSAIATYGEDDYDDGFFSGQQQQQSAEAAAEALEGRIEKAHGIIGCITFALLFPLGGIFLRLLPGKLSLYLHALWQVLALCLAIVTLGMGVWLAKGTEYIETYHAIIGLFVIASVCVQPVTGWLHHMAFKKSGGSKGAMTYLHRYWGIGIVTLGTINGGFGLQLAGSERKYVIVYAVMAALIWVVWMAISAVAQCFGGFRRKKATSDHLRSKGVGSDAEVGKPSTDMREAH
ncbi:hypothetical protein N0V82_009541 [Gnomoniopsis sp. IMI 355080]|nr:hypothetical protein N0V82_009541 [Gnomoniopsis sp. IMI 355080]